MNTELRKKILKRWNALKNERSSWDEHWQDISRNLLPRNGRFIVTDRNKGDKRFNKIYDSTATRALRILEAGMMSGMTSPARPWFKLTIANDNLISSHEVKVWCDQVTELMHQVFSRSNTYEALQRIYEELGAFGTAASIITFDFENVIHHYPLTIGEYCIATNHKDQVDTLYRKFQKTVAQVVDDFGVENVSDSVKRQYEEGQYDNWVTIIHAIEPRRNRDPAKRDNKNMPFRSVYIEEASREDKVLRESGYRRFPAVCPRWSVSGGDIYGNSPGMEALGDIHQLQIEQKRKAQAIEYKTRPPLAFPKDLMGRENDTLPGGIVYTDTTSLAGIRPLFEANLDLSHIKEDINETQNRINGNFFSDVFMMISSQTDHKMTATEVAERHEEKMLVLGPVLERLQNELLNPLIETTFDFMTEARILPPPPDELQGVDINIQLVSILAQAQVAIQMNSIDRFIGSVGQVAAINQNVLDKVNFDSYVDVAAKALGIDQSLIVPDEQVQAVREQRAQQQQAQQQAEMVNQAADTMQKLGSANKDAGSMDGLTGYS